MEKKVKFNILDSEASSSSFEITYSSDDDSIFYSYSQTNDPTNNSTELWWDEWEEMWKELFDRLEKIYYNALQNKSKQMITYFDKLTEELESLQKID